MKRKEPDEGNLKQSKTKMSKSFGNSEIDKEKKYDRQLRLIFSLIRGTLCSYYRIQCLKFFM